LLSPLAGNNSWTIAEVAGDDTSDGTQRLLNTGTAEHGVVGGC
jgi:hypothetical protein